ncbi:MAG: GTPase Era [Burkholderiaceae bacterium]|nr:MAG: GTPase Era [Burkholderiaceae bacterium]
MTSAGSSYRTGTLAIVGRPNVGKSTLLNRLVGQKVSITSRKPQTTRHRILGIHTSDAAQYIFVDTPGFQTRHGGALNRMLNRTVTQVLQEVDVVLWVIEAGRLQSGDQLILDMLSQQKAGQAKVCVVLNKADRIIDKAALLTFSQELNRQFPFSAIVPLSAKSGKGVDALLDAVTPMLPEQAAFYDADDMTDRNERFLASEFIREKLFRLLGEELPYDSTVVIDQFTQEGNLRRIAATILVARDAHKAMVIGAGGEKLKQIGTEARQDMEKLFGSKVFLELWVKVKSGWADSEASLRQYGYE